MRLVLALAAALISAPVMAGDSPPSPPASPPAPPSAKPTTITAAAVALFGPALHVSDVGKAVKFYTEGLGMRVVMEMGPPKRHETMISFGTLPRQPGLILLSDGTAKTPPKIMQSNGFDRLVMRVNDLGEVVLRLRRLGYSASDVKDVAMGYRMATATDPDGYKLELVETVRKAP